MACRYKVVMVRHGESDWNAENRFTGWFDSDLCPSGAEDARNAGKFLKEQGYTFDVAHTSMLKRAIKTLYWIQDEMELHWIPVRRHWRLNERSYGALQGYRREDMVRQHGEKQVKIWRRSYDVRPPELDVDDTRWPGHDLRYKDVDREVLPTAECLKDCLERVLPYWYDVIVPDIKKGERVLIAAHGNSLRSLIKYLDHMSDEDVMALNLPPGMPIVYELDEDLRPVKHYYVASDEQLQFCMDKVAATFRFPATV